MLVAVHMSEGEAGLCHLRRLRGELPADLFHANASREKPFHKMDIVIVKNAFPRHKRRNLLRRKHRKAVHQREVHAHAELRMGERRLHRAVKSLPAGHERRRPQNPTLDALRHGAIDERVPPEIVGIHQQLIFFLLHQSFLFKNFRDRIFPCIITQPPGKPGKFKKSPRKRAACCWGRSGSC